MTNSTEPKDDKKRRLIGLALALLGMSLAVGASLIAARNNDAGNAPARQTTAP